MAERLRKAPLVTCMFDRIDDTIVAVSSPPGAGVRGIIRLSGPRALALAHDVFASEDGASLVDAPGHRRHLGTVRLAEAARIPAEAYTFRAPASYTRQDLVELHVPGSPPVLAILLERLTLAGARMAEPGEFTGRAFLSGAIDLTRVEGVAAMIHAQTDAQLRASQALLHGALSRETYALREQLADMLAMIEAQIDFAEEPIEFVSPDEVLHTVTSAAGRIDALLTQSLSAERLEAFPTVVLTGPPNAGKSTLFNRLTGVNRAIQSATAGTTRDAIAASLCLPAGEAMLCDTAGVLAPLSMHIDGRPGSADDHLAGQMEAATRRVLASADLILLVVEVAGNVELELSRMSEWFAGRAFQVVLNKLDSPVMDIDAIITRIRSRYPLLAAVSARTGDGIDALREGISNLLFSNADTHDAAMLSLSNRQRGALQDALDALRRARALIDCEPRSSTPAELLALEIRHAMHALSMLSGAVTTEDLLGRIFARFCIGK